MIALEENRVDGWTIITWTCDNCGRELKIVFRREAQDEGTRLPGLDNWRHSRRPWISEHTDPLALDYVTVCSKACAQSVSEESYETGK